MALELELHHVPQFAADVGDLDRLDGDRRARKPEGDGANAQTSLIDLRPQGRRRLLGVDRERLELRAADGSGDETVAHEDQGQARAPPDHEG